MMIHIYPQRSAGTLIVHNDAFLTIPPGGVYQKTNNVTLPFTQSGAYYLFISTCLCPSPKRIKVNQ
jgi:hypothetical protein